MMFSHRLARTAAVAVTIAACAVPAASAEPLDSSLSLDALPAYPSPIVESTQDIRNPDTRDFADGRGTYNAPEIVVVESPAPIPQPTAGGMDWQDAGIGAGGLLAASLIAVGGTLLVTQRRGARTQEAH